MISKKVILEKIKDCGINLFGGLLENKDISRTVK
jgi:hypothetical protein